MDNVQLVTLRYREEQRREEIDCAGWKPLQIWPGTRWLLFKSGLERHSFWSRAEATVAGARIS